MSKHQTPHLVGRYSSEAVVARLRECLPRFAERIQVETKISEFGFDSFDLVELLCLVESEFSVRIDDEDFHSCTTVGELVELICRGKK